MKNIVILLLFIVSTNVLADWSSRDYDNMSKIEKDSLRMYINGVGEGSSWMSIIQESNNKEYRKLYCPPVDLVLDVNKYVDILEKRINKVKNLNLYNLENSPIGMELVNGLIDTFPCDKKWKN